MKIATITKTNTKGQVVIPKDLRDLFDIHAGTPLHIRKSGDGIFIHPVHRVVHAHEAEQSYVNVLKSTKGAWREDASWVQMRKKRKVLEETASKKRKSTW